jgi:hypothetical protein
MLQNSQTTRVSTNLLISLDLSSSDIRTALEADVQSRFPASLVDVCDRYIEATSSAGQLATFKTESIEHGFDSEYVDEILKGQHKMIELANINIFSWSVNLSGIGWAYTVGAIDSATTLATFESAVQCTTFQEETDPLLLVEMLETVLIEITGSNGGISIDDVLRIGFLTIFDNASSGYEILKSGKLGNNKRACRKYDEQFESVRAMIA